MSYTTAEEKEIQKHEAVVSRALKLTKDRKNKHGNKQRAETDGLKVIHKTHQKTSITYDDDLGEIDLRRVRSLSDLGD